MPDLTTHLIPSAQGVIPTVEGGGGAESAVIVLHQAAGITAQIEQTVETLAHEGFWALAPQLFHRKPNEEIPFPTGPEDFLAFDRWLGGDAELTADIGATLDYIQAVGIPVERVGVVGFSYGGRAAFLAATEWALGAAISYYGVGVQQRSFVGNDHLLPLSGRRLRTPWLGLYGDADRFLGPGELDELEGAIAQSEVEAQLVRYPGAVHGFDVDGPRAPQPFDPQPGLDAQRRTLEFLRSHLS